MPDSFVVAFAFGIGPKSPANQSVREAALAVPNVAIVTQEDLGNHERFIQIKDGPYGPPTTLMIAREAVTYAIKKRRSTILVAAAPPHLYRCMRDVRRVIEEHRLDHLIRAEVLPLRPPQGPYHWFYPNPQAHTTIAWRWWMRETMVRLLPFFIYRRIAR